MKNILRNAGILVACWFIAMLIFSVLNQVTQINYLWQIFLVPAAFFALISLITSLVEQKTHALRKLSPLFIILAIVIDQAIKLYLFSKNWEAMNIPVISPVFHINPSHNTLGSYLWVLIGWKGASNLLNVFLVVLLGIVFIEFWRYYRSKRRNSLWINLFANLLVAGALCNITDNLFHGGSLDYLTIQPFYITDLKDIYITLALMSIAIEFVDNKLYKKENSIDEEFTSFFKADLKRLFKRKE